MVEKDLIKSIKFKTEIINCDSSQSKWQSFQKILNVYSIEDTEKRLKAIKYKLKCKKFSNVQFVNIKKFQAVGCGITQVSKDLQKKGINLNEIVLNKNNLQSLDSWSSTTKVSKVELAYNQLKNINRLSKLTTMHTLNFKGNQLQDYSGLENMVSIFNLNLEGNNMQNVDFLLNLRNIDTLNLKNTNLKSVDGIKNVRKIRILNHSENKLKSIAVL